MRRFAVLLMVALVASFAMAEEKSANKQKLESLEKAIREEVGKAMSEDTNDCRVIGLAEKSCGGHYQYIVYSRQWSDESTLNKLVAEYNELEKKVAAEEGRKPEECKPGKAPKTAIVEGVCAVAK